MADLDMIPLKSPPVRGFPLLHYGHIVPGLAVVPPMTLTDYRNYYIEIGLAVDLGQNTNTATTYTKKRFMA